MTYRCSIPAPTSGAAYGEYSEALVKWLPVLFWNRLCLIPLSDQVLACVVSSSCVCVSASCRVLLSIVLLLCSVSSVQSSGSFLSSPPDPRFLSGCRVPSCCCWFLNVLQTQHFPSSWEIMDGNMWSEQFTYSGSLIQLSTHAQDIIKISVISGGFMLITNCHSTKPQQWFCCEDLMLD